MDTSFLVEALIDVLVSLIGPVVIGISMFVLWRTLRRIGSSNSRAFGLLADGFGFLFLSIAAPFVVGLIALLVGDSADEISELWFSVPATLLTVVGTIYIVLGTKAMVRPQAPDG